jgi:phage tail tape-measure protein
LKKARTHEAVDLIFPLLFPKQSKIILKNNNKIISKKILKKYHASLSNLIQYLFKIYLYAEALKMNREKEYLTEKIGNKRR